MYNHDGTRFLNSIIKVVAKLSMNPMITYHTNTRICFSLGLLTIITIRGISKAHTSDQSLRVCKNFIYYCFFIVSLIKLLKLFVLSITVSAQTGVQSVGQGGLQFIHGGHGSVPPVADRTFSFLSTTLVL